MSMRNKFLLDWDTINSLFNVLLHKTPVSVSITALIPLRNELDSKNGVLPGTMAMRNLA
jgi:hypothetical protein